MKRSGTITSAAFLATLAANSGWTGTPERFAGEQRLQAAVLHHGTDIELPLLLLDEVHPTGRHGRFVTNAALKWGMPQPVVHTAPLASVEPNRYAIIVQAHSGASALDSSDVDQLLETGAIIVAAAGNTGQGNAQGAESTTRYLTPSHDHWKGPQGRAWWQRAVNLMEAGTPDRRPCEHAASRWLGSRHERPLWRHRAVVLHSAKQARKDLAKDQHRRPRPSLEASSRFSPHSAQRQ